MSYTNKLRSIFNGRDFDDRIFVLIFWSGFGTLRSIFDEHWRKIFLSASRTFLKPSRLRKNIENQIVDEHTINTFPRLWKFERRAMYG